MNLDIWLQLRWAFFQ